MYRDITTSIIIPVIIDDQRLVEMTMKCLQLIGQTVDRQTTEVILIDNGSKLPAYFKTDVHIKNPGNFGYGPAVNQGIKIARGKYIVAMNNDVYVQAGWLEPLIEAVEANKEIGVIRPVVTGQSVYGEDKRKFGEPKVVMQQTNFHGFCYLIPREIIEKVGMFDEQFRPGYCEDVDMWVRITKAGYKMAKCSESRVEHLGGMTSSLLNKDEASFHQLLNTNRKRFKAKHGFDVFSEEWYDQWQALRGKFGEV